MIIGLDVGASWIKGVAIEKKLILAEKIAASRNLKQFKLDIIKLINKLSSGKNPRAIGVGVAGHVAPEKIIHSNNIGYLNNFALPSFIKKYYSVPVIMDNDARCFLRAEINLGAAKGTQSCMGVTLGSGLGGALSLKKEIIFGSHNTAGELGHIFVNGKEFENIASSKLLRKNKNNYSQMGDNLGLGLISAINLYDPEIIVIGGGIAQDKIAINIIVRRAKLQINKHLKNLPAKKVKIKISKLGDFAGALGATFLYQSTKAT